ncbi:hypothetical protein [Melghirimyces algeriensis]|uniref:Uncharacterized protein n=1 Tax=Melghirimyces algeriensis TaxID=910412 RepID=A0A521F7A2_9BACL|nr:hypothetical protein [Melghirimyces algeriensis]SMO92017.1 hypothetical protein SAMN06264849_11412 [Melghirimyces algeriensis]
MIKTIKYYDVESVSGVIRFIRDWRHHRIDAKYAVIDFHSAVKQANLTPEEASAVELVMDYGVELSLSARYVFVRACQKIAKVFRKKNYGRMKITKFC